MLSPAEKITQVSEYLQQLQRKITHQLEVIDGRAKFIIDSWRKPDGGFGSTRVIKNGNIFEKGGVNFSYVFGKQLPLAASKKHPQLAGSSFEAVGISIVLHPDNPFIPTCHANLRFFLAQKDNKKPIWWFGGGYDLTPYYGFIEDCRHWHQTAYDACVPFGEEVYLRFKQWCDDYFYLKHREEARGIGGIFFDDLNQWGFAKTFEFATRIGNSFLPAYVPIIKKRCQYPFGEREKNFQNFRRARYVEFNLIYDRGTLFGLQFGGRTESILISMPPMANWEYNWRPDAGTPEAELTEIFLPPRNWLV